MTTKLNGMDLAFLFLEDRMTPVNVAFLTVLSIPDNYSGNYPRDLLDKLEAQVPQPPFNQKLTSDSLVRQPAWVEDDQFDIHYHVRHSALPKPGKIEDLLELVSRLHIRLLDRDRPLWEFHLIEGLEGNRFAMYMKMHHSTIDGMGGVELMENFLSAEPGHEERAPWCGVKKSKHLNKADDSSFIDNVKLAKDFASLIVNQGLKIAHLKNNLAPAPFTAPKSPFNGPITATRKFAVKSVSLSEIKEVGNQANATVNDIVLAMCSGGIRKYLREKGTLPKKSLIATVPVSVRQLNRSGNKITYVSANLATTEPDTMKRLTKISASTSTAKVEMENLDSGAVTGFAAAAQGIVGILNRLNINAMLPPPSNITISNVPGPRVPLYFGKAQLEANYPVSMLVPGQSLNITVVSYCDRIDFGLMACRDTLPDVEILADYIEQALDGIRGGIFLENLMKEKNVSPEENR